MEEKNVADGCVSLYVFMRTGRLVSEPLSMDRDSTTSLIGFPTEPPPKKGLESVTSSISAAGRYIGQKVRLPSLYCVTLSSYKYVHLHACSYTFSPLYNTTHTRVLNESLECRSRR